MYDSEMLKIIQQQPHMKKCFKGFFARDNLPPLTPSDLKQQDFSVIINTDKAGDEGEHWILFHWDSVSKTALFIDPLAQPLCEEFLKWLHCCQTIVVLHNPVQHHLSVLCGLFVLYFMYHLCASKSIVDIIKLFSTNNLQQNDDLVLKFAKQKLLYKPPPSLYKKRHGKNGRKKDVEDWMSRKSVDLWLHKER